MHSRNKETHLFGRSPDKEDYRGLKGSHKVNANSNSVPSSSVGGYARVLAQMAHICTRTFRCMCHNWALSLSLSETHPMLQPLESRFLPPAHSFRFIACSFLSLLPVRGKDLLSDPSATSHLNSSTLPCLIFDIKWYHHYGDIIITKRLSSCSFSIFGKGRM